MLLVVEATVVFVGVAMDTTEETTAATGEACEADTLAAAGTAQFGFGGGTAGGAGGGGGKAVVKGSAQ